MKKLWMLMLAAAMAAGLCLTASAAETETAHADHCLCGGAAVGVGDHTQCEDVTWQPISQAFAAVGRTVSTADFGKLPSGNYYLDADVTVTAASGIGTSTVTKTVAICLNGHDITYASGRALGTVHKASSLTLCDCSWDGSTFGGTVTGAGTHGGVTYTHTEATLNVFGGNYVGKASSSGGAFAVACDGCGDLDGSGAEDNTDRNMAPASVMNLYNGRITGGTVSANGGAIVLYHPAQLNMYGGTVIGGSAKYGGAISGSLGAVNIKGGTVIGGTASEAGGAIRVSSGGVYITGGVITGGVAKNTAEEAYILEADGKLVKATTLSNALAQVTDTQHILLVQDLDIDATVSGTVYLDLGGHTLSGITVTGTLYGMDSTTNAYDGSRAGSLSYTLSGSGQVAEHTRDPQTLRRYVRLENSDGSVSFHRFYMGITKVSLKPDTVSVGYKAVFAGTEEVKAQLAQENAFGCQMWTDPKVIVTCAYGQEEFVNKREVSFRVSNFLNESLSDAKNEERAQLQLYAQVFLRFRDGTQITGTEISYSFRQMLELTNEHFSSYSLTQKNYLQELSAKFSNVMMSWDISEFHHVTGSMWTKVTASGFLAKLTKSGSFYNIQQGHYALTEDVDIGDKKLRVVAGTEVVLCLNGHTLTGTNRLFRNDGTLTICDCHANDAEGTISSSYTSADLSTDKRYAPVMYTFAGSETNLYGGNLTATEQVTAAGVVALSHDMSGSPDLPGGVMNMYGGTISGGNALVNGGLVSVWNGATFNMYDGTLYGGYAGSYAGAIQNSGSTVNIYGGTIRDCSTDGYAGAVQNSGTLTMTGGLIQNCTAVTSGGGVYNSRYFYMHGGTIENCTSGNEGGGVRNSSYTFHMTGGTIRSCTAKKGGNLLNASVKDCIISGGTVTGGTAEDYPGVCLVNTTAVMSGDPKIYGNNGSNLGLDWKSSVSASNMLPDANVYISSFIHGLIGEDATAADVFTCEDAGYTVREMGGRSFLWNESYTEFGTAPQGFSVGFGRVNINPELGTAMGGYGTQLTRVVTEIDTYELYATVVAITDEKGETVLLIAADLCNVSENELIFRRAVANAVGIPVDNIIMSASHSHSTPDISYQSNEKNKAYIYALSDKLITAATQAMADRGSAVMQVGSFEAEGMNFYRHYSYVEDGIVKYFGDNFGTDVRTNSALAGTIEHVDEVDPTMHLVRFVRDGKDILLSNWRAHPHRTGGAEKGLASSDVVGVMRHYVEQNQDVYFIYMQGAAGNVNTTSRLSSVNHGLSYTAYGKKLATMIGDNLSCLKTCTPGTFQIDNEKYVATLDVPTEEEYLAAKEVYDYIYREGNEFTTMAERTAYCKQFGYDSIYEVRTTVSRWDRGEGTQTLNINTVSLGKDLAFFSAPNELWDTVSVEIENASPFTTTLCFGYANGSNGYLHYKMVAEYKAYEVYNHRYVAPDTILGMIEYWKTTLNEQYQNLE